MTGLLLVLLWEATGLRSASAQDIVELDVRGGGVLERLGEIPADSGGDKLYTFVAGADEPYSVSVQLAADGGTGGALPHGLLTVWADLEGACPVDDLDCALAPTDPDDADSAPMYQQSFTQIETRDCEDLRDITAALESVRFEKLQGEDLGEVQLDSPDASAAIDVEAVAGLNYVFSSEPRGGNMSAAVSLAPLPASPAPMPASSPSG